MERAHGYTTHADQSIGTDALTESRVPTDHQLEAVTTARQRDNERRSSQRSPSLQPVDLQASAGWPRCRGGRRRAGSGSSNDQGHDTGSPHREPATCTMLACWAQSQEQAGSAWPTAGGQRKAQQQAERAWPTTAGGKRKAKCKRKEHGQKANGKRKANSKAGKRTANSRRKARGQQQAGSARPTAGGQQQAERSWPTAGGKRKAKCKRKEQWPTANGKRTANRGGKRMAKKLKEEQTNIKRKEHGQQQAERAQVTRGQRKTGCGNHHRQGSSFRSQP